jgi:L-threonylcarbamoyladenylate synthase
MAIPVLSLAEAVTALHTGGVIAYPTEGVWGLGCDPRNEAAVLRLLAVKQRAADKGLILVASQLEQLRPFLDIAALPADRLGEVLATWPGPHTWVMPAASATPRWISGVHDSVAVRISAHPQVVELCNAFGGAIISTSANHAGQPASSKRDSLDPALVAVLDGVTGGVTGGLSSATTIREALSGRTLRA